MYFFNIKKFQLECISIILTRNRDNKVLYKTVATHFIGILLFFLTLHKLIKIFNLYHNNTCNQAILKIEMLNSIYFNSKKNILSTVCTNN